MNSPENSLTDARTPSANGAAGESQQIVSHLNDLLISHGYDGVREWGAARRIATSSLRTIPAQELVDALTWAFTNSFWRQRLAARELKVLNEAWADWKDPNKATPIRKGNAYADHAGDWRLPRDAAREQFERALGRTVPRAKSTAHLPRAYGPRKKASQP